MTVVLLSFYDSGPVVVLCLCSCCRSLTVVGLLLFYDSDPVVVLWQWSCCYSMELVLLSFNDRRTVVVL